MPTRPRRLETLPPPPPCSRCGRRSAGPFAELAGPALSCLTRGRKVNRCLPGQVLYSEGNAPLAAFCVESGRFKLFRLTEDGRVPILRVVGPGTLLGAANVVTGQPYFESAEAVGPARVCLLDGAALRQALRADGGLWEALVRELGARVDSLQGELLDQAHRPAASKLAGVLLALLDPAGGEQSLPFSRRDLADMIGVSEETAIRSLSEFRRRKAISLEGRRIRVLQPELLRRQASA